MLTAVFKNKIFKFNVSFIIIFDTLSFPMSYLSNIKSQLTGIQTVTKTPSRSSGDIRCLLLGKDILHVHIHLKLCASFCRRRVETKSENKRQSQIIILPVLQIPAICHICKVSSSASDIPALTPAKAGTLFSDPRGLQG